MGFLDSFFGGDALDTGYANQQIQESKKLQEDIYNQLSSMIAPYSALGSGGAGKLGTYLGINVPSRSRQEIMDELLTGDTRSKYVTGSKANRQGKWQNTDGNVWTWSGGGDYQRNEGLLQSDIDAILAEEAASQQSDPNYGSLLESFTMDDYQESPNYQFNLSEGEKALKRAAAAQGDYYSPDTGKELLEYSQNLASNEYLNSYNMFNQNQDNIYNRLMGTVNVGQNAINQQIPVSTNYANSLTDLNSQLAGLDLSKQANDQARRQSAFSTLTGIAGMAAAPFTGGGSLMVSGSGIPGAQYSSLEQMRNSLRGTPYGMM